MNKRTSANPSAPLSDVGYRSIELFRFDEQTGVVLIFAGEELQIVIPSSGLWRFLDATEL